MRTRTVVRTMEESRMNWTTDIPTEPGFYWHRYDVEDTPEVVEISYLGSEQTPDERTMTRTGCDVPSGTWMGDDNEIGGEFWPERLTPP